VDSIVFEVKARSRPYRKEVKWYHLPSPPTSVSPAACGLLQTLAFQLEAARSRTSPEVFGWVWHSVARHMDTFVWREVVAANMFSCGGVEQLALDMTAGLLPVFGVWTARPRSHFPQTQDCLTLQQLATGSALLALDTLTGSSTEGAVNTLRELGIASLATDQAIAVIRTRIDVVTS